MASSWAFKFSARDPRRRTARLPRNAGEARGLMMVALSSGRRDHAVR